MARKMTLDFTGVESFKKASEGLHVCKIATAEVKQSQGGNDMIVVAYEVIKGDDKTARVYENYVLAENSLWKLKGLLQAIGMKADGKVSLDLDKLIGKVVNVMVKHEEYDGKIRARVDEVSKFTAATADEDADDDDSDDEVEEEAPKKSKPAKKPMNPPEEEDDEEWEEDEEEDEEPAPKKKPKKEESKPAKKAPKKPEPEEDEDDDWDDEDEEEEEKPAKKPEKSKAPEKKAPKKPAKKAADDDDEDWDDEDWDE